MGNVDHLDASCFSSGQTPDGKMRGESVCVYFDVDNKLFFTKKKARFWVAMWFSWLQYETPQRRRRSHEKVKERKKQTKNNNLRDGWGVEKLSTLTVLNMFVVFRLSILNSEYF